MPSKIRDIADILGVTEAANPTNAVLTSVADGSGLVVYATLDDLPTSGLTAGDQAYITSTNRLYVSNGSGWYNVALFNATPTLSISPSGSVTLAVDGVTPTIITLTGADSDNAIAGLTYSVESDGSFSNIATLSQDSSVFTITPLSEDSATPGSSTLTFKVSDGINFGSGTTEFSLTFGPDWTVAPTESKIVASDAEASKLFGHWVSISDDGNYAICGAQGDDHAGSSSGSAYIFVRSGSTWTQQARIVASDADAIGLFGNSVSINSDGTYAIVGSRGSKFSGALSGAVYVFTRSGSTWTQQARIQPTEVQEYDNFGYSVSVNSDATYVIIGANQEDGGAGDPLPQSGAAYVYTRSGSTWTQQAKITASDAQSSDNFGNSVSINSDATYAIVGTPYEDGGVGDPIGGAGAAYIFTRSGSTWTQQAKLTASDAELNDYFGWDASISGDGTYAIVGAENEDSTAIQSGAAYIFVRSGSTWTQQAKIQASVPTWEYRFGRSVSIDQYATYAIVGEYAYNIPSGGVPSSGNAYIFERDGSTWTEVKKITPSDGQAGDNFGFSVSINSDGSYAIIGAYIENGGAGDPLSQAGAAYIYEA